MNGSTRRILITVSGFVVLGSLLFGWHWGLDYLGQRVDRTLNVDGIYDLFDRTWFVILAGVCSGGIIWFVGFAVYGYDNQPIYYWVGSLNLFGIIVGMMSYEERFTPRILTGMAMTVLIIYIILVWTLKYCAKVKEAELFLEYLPEVELECDPNDAARWNSVRFQTIIDVEGIGIRSIDRQELKDGVFVKLKIADSHCANYDRVIADMESRGCFKFSVRNTKTSK